MSIKMEFFIEKMVMWKRYAFASKVGWWPPKQLVPIKKETVVVSLVHPQGFEPWTP